jgi:hypothetical protein
VDISSTLKFIREMPDYKRKFYLKFVRKRIFLKNPVWQRCVWDRIVFKIIHFGDIFENQIAHS